MDEILELIITLAEVLQENGKAIFLEQFLFLLLFSKRHGTVLAYFNEYIDKSPV